MFSKRLGVTDNIQLSSIPHAFLIFLRESSLITDELSLAAQHVSIFYFGRLGTKTYNTKIHVV